MLLFMSDKDSKQKGENNSEDQMGFDRIQSMGNDHDLYISGNLNDDFEFYRLKHHFHHK